MEHAVEDAAGKRWPDGPGAGVTRGFAGFDAGEFRGPSPRLWLARRLQLAAVALPVVAGGTVAGWLLAGAAVGCAVLAGLVVVTLATGSFLYGRYRSWRYLERADDLLVHRGVMISRLSVVPYGRMQFVDVTAGPVERVLGLATVQLHTAAAATDAQIPGLPRPEADRLRDRLAELGEARAAGL